MTSLDPDENICVCETEVRRPRCVCYKVALNHKRSEIASATAVYSNVLLHAMQDVHFLGFAHQYPCHRFSAAQDQFSTCTCSGLAHEILYLLVLVLGFVNSFPLLCFEFCLCLDVIAQGVVN